MKSQGEPVVGECQCDRAAREEDERQRGSGGVESVRASDDQFHAVVERLGAGVAELQPSGGEDALAVFADRASEPDERL